MGVLWRGWMWSSGTVLAINESLSIIFPFGKMILHMSAEPKWCFLNYPKGVMGIFLVLTMSFIRGYVSSNQIHLLFGIFVQKMVKNTWKRAFKGLYWFGLAWSCLSNDPGEVLTSQNPKNCIKIAKTLTIKYHWNCLILAFSIAPFWTFWSIFYV